VQSALAASILLPAEKLDFAASEPNDRFATNQNVIGAELQLHVNLTPYSLAVFAEIILR